MTMRSVHKSTKPYFSRNLGPHTAYGGTDTARQRVQPARQGISMAFSDLEGHLYFIRFFFLLLIRRTTDKALYYTPSHLPCSAQCRTCDRSGLSTYINGTGGNTEGELNDSLGVALHMLHGGKHVADRVLCSFIRLKSLCLRHCFSVNQTFPSLEFVQ